MKFFLKCDEVAHVCDKNQYNEAGFGDKLMMKVHLLMCKLCRGYSNRNQKLTKTLNSANLKTLNSEEKEFLKTRLQQEVNKTQEP